MRKAATAPRMPVDAGADMKSRRRGWPIATAGRALLRREPRCRVVVALLAMLGVAAGGTPALAQAGRLEVLPVVFIPADNRDIAAGGQIEAVRDLLARHLALAQAHYRSLLKSDTFKISERGVVVFAAARPAAAYETQVATGGPDTAHIMLKELFAWSGEDRYGSRRVYLVIYARPAHSHGPALGGGRTFNGQPNSGGGFIHMELASLLTDKPYPFQSTLVHELGHAFGLAHADCHGYDLGRSESMMSYNRRHHSQGLRQSLPLAGLAPEDFVVLAQNRLAFPAFAYAAAEHNPTNKPMPTIEPCYLGAMSAAIGPLRRMPGVGYELVFDGRVVSGPETAFYTPAQARGNCAQNRRTQRGVRVECRYGGKRLDVD